MIQFLKSGQRLEKPEITPDAIWQLMTDCWRLAPEERPTFAQLEENLAALLLTSSSIGHNSSPATSNDLYLKMTDKHIPEIMAQGGQASAQISSSPKRDFVPKNFYTNEPI